MSKNLLFAGAVLLGCTFCFQQSLAGPLRSAEVTKIINRVAVIDPAAGEHPATVREVIKDDLGLQTGERSRSELLFQDNTLTRIGAETFFSFKTGTRDMTLEKGSMLLQVPKGLGGAKIHTAAVTAAITGTTIMMEYIPGKYIKVLVLEGSLRLSRNGRFGDSLVLRPGKMVIMQPDAKRIPEPVDVDLKHIVKTSTLVNFPDSAPLPSMSLIQASIDAQKNSIAQGDLAPTNLVMGHGTDVIVASDDQLKRIAALTPADVNGNTQSSAGLPFDSNAETGETLVASADTLPVAEPVNEITATTTVLASATESLPLPSPVSLTDAATPTVTSVTDSATSLLGTLTTDSTSAVASLTESVSSLLAPVTSDATALVESVTPSVTPVLATVADTTTSLIEMVTANGASLPNIGSATDTTTSLLSSVATSTGALPSLGSVTDATAPLVNSVTTSTAPISSVASITDPTSALLGSAVTSTVPSQVASAPETTAQILNSVTASPNSLPIAPITTATASLPIAGTTLNAPTSGSLPGTTTTSLPTSTGSTSSPVTALLNTAPTATSPTVSVASSTQLLTLLNNTAPSTGGGTVTVNPTTVSGATVAAAPTVTSSPAPENSSLATTAATVAPSSSTTLTSSTSTTSLATLTSAPTTLVTSTAPSTTTETTALPLFGR